jgi:hypothetical protein
LRFAPRWPAALIAAEQASSVRAYNLPAAPLASTLNQIASQAGLALTLNPSLAAGKTSAPVKASSTPLAPCVKPARHRPATGAEQQRHLQPGGRARGRLGPAGDQRDRHTRH